MLPYRYMHILCLKGARVLRGRSSYPGRGMGLCLNTGSKIPYDNKERGSQKSKSVSFREWGDPHNQVATKIEMLKL